MTVMAVFPLVHAEQWLVINNDGSEFVSDNANHRGYRMITRSWKGWRDLKNISPANNRRDKFAQQIENVSNKYNIPAALVHAVISAESAYNPEAVSPMGATGLMQLMPETAKRYGVEDRKDPEQNIKGGVQYLRDLLVMFDNDLSLTLAAYNAGENAVKKYSNKIPPYTETQNYVRKVMNNYYRNKTALTLKSRLSVISAQK